MRKLVAEQMEGEGGNKWAEIAKSLPGRNGKQCRERCEHSLPRRRRVPHPVHPNPIPVTSYPCHILSLSHPTPFRPILPIEAGTTSSTRA